MFIPSDLIKTPNFDNSTPNTYSYITATDTLDQVAAPFYFAGSDIRPSDVISVRSIDGEMTFTANGLTAMPSAGEVGRVSQMMIATSTQAQHQGREYPTLIKSSVNPIVSLTDQTANSIAWPWIVDLTVAGGDGVALFWSTDHSTHATSGTWMATAPSPATPSSGWTHRGMIFRDDATGGEQHETPSVMWDEVNSRWLMYYQLKFVPGYTNQLTMVATATELTGTWTVLGVAASEKYTNNAGDGHSGYFKPFRYNGGWYAYSLYGGTNNSRKAFWISYDNGVTYQVHPQILQNNQHLISHIDGFDAETWMLKYNSGSLFNRLGKNWVIMPAGPAASGGVEIPIAKIVACSVSNDCVTFGRAIDITPPLQAWENAELGVDFFGNTVYWGGKHYAVFRSGGPDGGFGIAEII